jgi:preprotein translocase subunit SecB
MAYGGILSSKSAGSGSAILLIECPRMMFPFVRRIIADRVSDGGCRP